MSETHPKDILSYIKELISTTSINGQTLNMLTETRIKHTTESKQAKKGFGMGGGGQPSGGGGMF